ncbi:AraC-like ligand-binding domain-containing protein [Sphaerimonospora thailandensis]|nr:helix-turn-helix domain-containing protein [Sphaerimonospora thailandensis]
MSRKMLTPAVVRSDHKENFQATAYALDFGAIRVCSQTYSPLHVHRSRKLIWRFDPEMYCLSLTVSGRRGIAQSGREAACGPGDFMFYETSSPFQGWADTDGDNPPQCVIVQIPKTLLPLSADGLGRLVAVRLPGGHGLTELVSRHLGELVRQATTYTEADVNRLTTITLDLVAALCANQLEAASSLPPESRRRVLQAQIHRFVLERLGDPELSPATIATAHKISPRYLYQLFEEQSLPIASWIRQLRLERCRRDLANPHLGSVPVRAIAARWGFIDSAHFSRAFRTVYELSPSEYRQLTRRRPGMQTSSTAVQGTPKTSQV